MDPAGGINSQASFMSNASSSSSASTRRKNLLANIENKLYSGFYRANRNTYKRNRSAVLAKRAGLAKRGNVERTAQLNSLLERMKKDGDPDGKIRAKRLRVVLEQLPEKVDEDELDEEEEGAETEGVCRPDGKDTYTKDILIEQYNLHKAYVEGRKASALKLKITIRLPNIPEDISENLIKFIIHKLGDKTSDWSCSKGDLFSKVEGIQECKCFTSDGPLSFSPKTDWNAIYFLDARRWLSNQFKLYKISLKKSDPKWLNIQVSKTQTFEDQMKQGRRPRIGWNNLVPQVEEDTELVFEGTFEDIFMP